MHYTMTERVRFSETDEQLRMTLYSILNHLQDCATFHGEAAGVGLMHNRAQHCAWIVADMQLLIYRRPAFGEEICVTTWPQSYRGRIAQRGFSIETTEGETLALALSEWVFMDMAAYAPLHIPEEQIHAYGLAPREMPLAALGRRKVRAPEGMEARAAFAVIEAHLDANGHMNNAQYVRLARKFLPEHFAVRHLRCEWKRQAKLGDVLQPRVACANGAATVVFQNPAGELYFIVEFEE